MAFPQTPIDLLAEMQIGGTWTDITSDLYARGPLTIERGRPDEAARVDPARASLLLNNRGNKYSPRNPRSTNYGLIGRNTPVRFSVPGTESYLALDGNPANTIATPDHASFAVTDLDVRAELTMDWYSTTLNQTVMGQWGADGNRGWSWRIRNGYSILNWTTAGTTASALFFEAQLPQLPRRAALRMTLDVNNGSSGFTGALYWADTLAGPWNLVFTAAVGGTTSIFNSTAALEIGPDQADVTPPRRPLIGRVHRAELLASIGGAAIANPDFRAKTPGTTSFADTAGRTWTLTGTAAITNREYRLHAEVSSWPSRWDVSGQDVYVPVEASGVLRRLGAGTKALASTLRRRIPSYSPVAYWPMEEGRDAAQAYSPVAGVQPLSVTGFDFASDDTCPGSSSLPKIDGSASMTGTVPTYTSTGSWIVSFQYLLGSYPGSSARILEITTTGTCQRITLTLTPSAVELRGYNSSGTEILNEDAAIVGVAGAEWRRLDLSAGDAGGGNTHFHAGWVTPLAGGYAMDDTITATPGIVTGITTNFGVALADMRIGHLAVLPSDVTDVYAYAEAGYAGETASTRMLRLAREESVPVHLDQPTYMGAQVGAQRPSPLLTLLAETADADGGVLYEDRSDLALRHRWRGSLYNRAVALTLDYSAAGEVAPPLEPVDDDQHVRNDRTVTRTNGSSSRAVLASGALSVQAPPNGVGIYDDSRDLNLYSDSQPEGMAWWLLHVGTWDEARFPSVHIDLAAAPHLIPAVLALDIGDRIQIINPPSWLPPGPIDLTVEGYTETIGHPNSWDVVLNCSPAGPWTVAALDSTSLGRLDTSGSTLALGISSSATSLSVATTTGALWSTVSGHRPFNIVIGGEVMTVTNLTGASSPQTVTVTRSVNGVAKSHSSGAPVRLAQAAILAL
ncbi:hypothetical protein [Streptomyces goshikiensis]